MWRSVIHPGFGASLLGLAIFGAPHSAVAAPHDGSWSVLIVTEKGGCDRGYRYNVNVSNGHVKYEGGAPVDLSGTVESTGQVKVNIKLGDKGANGIGQLSGNTGTGTWRGIGSNGSCAGHWEAERL